MDREKDDSVLNDTPSSLDYSADTSALDTSAAACCTRTRGIYSTKFAEPEKEGNNSVQKTGKKNSLAGYDYKEGIKRKKLGKQGKIFKEK